MLAVRAEGISLDCAVQSAPASGGLRDFPACGSTPCLERLGGDSGGLRPIAEVIGDLSSGILCMVSLTFLGKG